MASARFGRMFSALRSVSVSQRMSFRFLADSGRMIATAAPRARVATLRAFRFAVAELRFVARLVFPADFMIGHPSFDFAVEIDCHHRGLCKRAILLFRSLLAVVALLPSLVFRLAAVFDVARHVQLALRRSLRRVIGANMVGVFLSLQHRAVLRAIGHVVVTLFGDLLPSRLVLAAPQARTAPVAVKLQALRA